MQPPVPTICPSPGVTDGDVAQVKQFICDHWDWSDRFDSLAKQIDDGFPLSWGQINVTLEKMYLNGYANYTPLGWRVYYRPEFSSITRTLSG